MHQNANLCLAANAFLPSCDSIAMLLKSDPNVIWRYTGLVPAPYARYRGCNGCIRRVVKISTIRFNIVLPNKCEANTSGVHFHPLGNPFLVLRRVNWFWVNMRSCVVLQNNVREKCRTLHCVSKGDICSLHTKRVRAPYITKKMLYGAQL